MGEEEVEEEEEEESLFKADAENWEEGKEEGGGVLLQLTIRMRSAQSILKRVYTQNIDTLDVH